MKQFQIEIINVTQPVKVKNYHTLEVAYKSGGKVMGKKLFDFNSPEVYKTISEAKPGQFFTVSLGEKNEKGYSNWEEISQVSAQDVQNSGGDTNKENEKPSAPVSGRVTGSNYETPEERATRQVAIIRQATLNMAIEFLGSESDVDSITSTAKEFENYIFDDLALASKLYREKVKSV